MKIPYCMAATGVAELFRQNKVLTTTPLNTIVGDTTYKLRIEVSQDGRMEFTIWKSSKTNGRKVGRSEKAPLSKEATNKIVNMLANAILFEPSEQNSRYDTALELERLVENEIVSAGKILVGNRNNKIYLSVIIVDSLFPVLYFEMNNLEN